MTISSIIAALGALDITYDSDVTVNVWEYNEIKDTLNESECPVRMIGKNDDKQTASFEVRNLNNAGRAEWNILDKLYIFPTPLDQGIENNNRKILDYMDAYMTAIKANQCLGLTATTVTYVEFSPPYVDTYPQAEGSPIFWVVDAVVTVEEYR